MAVSASDDGESERSFEDWLATEAVPNNSDITVLIEVIKRRCARMSDVRLLSDFSSISTVFLKLVQREYSNGDLDNALDLLDIYWDLIRRVDGVFKFPSVVAPLLSLESNIHRARNDLPALKKSDFVLWKLLKQYEWLGDEIETRRRQRAFAAFSLAVTMASMGDCDSSAYFIRDFVQMARLMSFSREEIENLSKKSVSGVVDPSRSPLVASGLASFSVLPMTKSSAIPDARHDEETAQTILHLLMSSLRAHYFLKYSERSACASAFKFAAREVYDVVFGLTPHLLPHWQDLKRGIRENTKKELLKANQHSGKVVR